MIGKAFLLCGDCGETIEYDVPKVTGEFTITHVCPTPGKFLREKRVSYYSLSGIKEVPIGPISGKLVMLQGYLHDQGEEEYVELKTKWLQEMIDEINAKVQELLKVIHDD